MSPDTLDSARPTCNEWSTQVYQWIRYNARGTKKSNANG
jgi:hypothetical protein